jgi:2-dehydropantoate 2-reductase
VRIVVLGAGAVGLYFGGRLAQAQRDVTFIARGQTLEALRSRGLQLESMLGNAHIENITATDDLSILRTADIVVVAVKAHQLPEVAGSIAPVLRDGALILPLQNGIQSYDVLSSVLGPQRVIHGFCRVLSATVSPACVRHSGAEPTILCGEVDGSRSTRTEAVLESLAGVPGMTVIVSDDIRREIWEKFIFVAPLGSVGAVARFPAGVLRSIPETRRALQASMQEIIAVGRAEGVALPLDGDARGMADIDALPATATASMQRDLIAGRQSELTGQIAPLLRLAEEHGVPTPVNNVLYAALLPSELAARGELCDEPRL